MEINLIYGPPGTGKTTKLLNIIETELQAVEPNKIAYVSFTKKGVYEGRDRALQKFNYSRNDFCYFRTLHSIAFKELGINRSMMINKDHYRQLSHALNMNFTGYYTEEFHHNDDQYLFFDILHRNNSQTASNYLDGLDMNILKYVRNNYKRFRQEMHVKDFTDLLEQFCQMNKALPVEVAVIDEAQDLTLLQWKMVWIAFRDCKKIYIAGDDDQAIYEWSGSDVNTLMNLKGSQTILSKSYRLPRTIWNYSDRIVNMINKRVLKRFTSKESLGSVNFIDHFDQLQIDNQKSWLFLARNNCFLKDIESYLKSKGFLYYKKGIISAKTSVIEAIRFYEKIRRTKNKPDHLYSLMDFVNIKDCTFTEPWYNVFLLKEDEINYYRDLFANGFDFSNVNIRVDTIHSSKGSEADNVVIITDITSNVSSNLENNPDSELRCFYVGITRTKENLYICLPQTKHYYDW